MTFDAIAVWRCDGKLPGECVNEVNGGEGFRFGDNASIHHGASMQKRQAEWERKGGICCICHRIAQN